MLAIIPARGGSKGVPRKNVRDLCGKPLLAYTIEAALDSEVFEKVIVSTDDQEIANIAVRFGAEVPFIRPEILSSDEVSSDDVIQQAIEYYEQEEAFYDEICKLQPTSPLRRADHIRYAYELFKEKRANFLVSVCECEHSPLWADKIGDDLSMDNFMCNVDKKTCRQYLPKYYRLNGAISMAKTDALKNNKSFIGKGGYAYIMSQEDSVDIDSELDFKLSEYLIKQKAVNKEG